MAISLAYGVLFATLITLFLVPSLYLILYDFSEHSHLKKRYAKKATEPSPVAETA
jgi:predicted RND superfamily exporter protein